MSLFRRRANTGTDVGTLIRKADALRDARDSAAAADAYAAVLLHAPERIDLQVQCGNMLKDSGRLAEAESLYRKALAARPHDADIHLQLGHVLKMKGNLQEARSAYRAALAIDPTSGNARIELLNLGDIDLDAGAARPARYAATLTDISDVSRRLGVLEAEVAALRRMLPDRLAVQAFPVEHWADLRRLFTVPPPRGSCPGDAPLHVVLDGSDDDEAGLHARISALTSQRLAAYTASIIATGPLAKAVARYSQADSRLSLASSLLEAIDAARAPVVILSTGGDRLDPHALAWFDRALRLTGAHGATCDSETLMRGERSDDPASIVLRSPADPESLLEADLIGSTLAVKAAVLREQLDRAPSLTVAGAIRAIGLHLSPMFGLTHVPLPLVATPRSTSPAITEAVWPLLPQLRMLSVIIPTLAGGDDLLNMVTSLRQNAAQPDALEIIVVDNGCVAEAAAPLRELAKSGRLRVIDAPGPFNWAHLNNRAAAEAAGDILVFVNDDMRMLSPRWDDRLRGQLARPSVGAVGAKLLYPQGSIQHGGIIVGWPGGTVHDGLDRDGSDRGPTLRYAVTRRVAAVTGAFLAVRKHDFDALNGFDAVRFAVAYNDVDFCFRLREAGLAILWTPHIVLTHDESKTRGRDDATAETLARQQAEYRALVSLWGDALDRDPAVNPFWFAYGRPLRLVWPPSIETIESLIASTGLFRDPFAIARNTASSMK